MIILGLNTWFHDTSACLVRDGELVVALEEERFTRDKHTRAFPAQAAQRCLEIAGIDYAQVDHVAVSICPTHQWRAKTLYALKAPRQSLPFLRHELVAGILKQRKFRAWVKACWPGSRQPRIHFVQHHLSHAAGTFFVSPYEHAAIMAIDGSGEWACAWLGEGRGRTVTCYNESLFPQSFGSPRQPGAVFEPQHQDVAAAFQQVLEECALAMAAVLKRRSQARHLVIAGGVALNSVMNGRLLREAGFDDVYIMPAAGDNGTCIGAAYTVLHQELGQEHCFVHDNPFIGNSYDDAAIEHLLKQFKLSYRRSDNIAVDAASLLERGCILGWFQGRMEIGPRALGARSILANPAYPDMKAKINSEVKFREAYRPSHPPRPLKQHRASLISMWKPPSC